MHSIQRFQKLAAEPRFKGWPLDGTYAFGEKIPYFGQMLHYRLMTGNGIEDYTSMLRHFGWAVVFGVTEEREVVTLVQWKPGVNQASWELPPGGIGKVPAGTTDEELLTKTQLAFLKETGYGYGSWSRLGHVMIETGKYRGAGPDDHGLPAHLYLATQLVRQAEERKPDPNEIMDTLMVPLPEFGDVIDAGLFTETSAVACALLALRKLKL